MRIPTNIRLNTCPEYYSFFPMMVKGMEKIWEYSVFTLQIRQDA
ncbi:MAG: hypothetical protein R3E08_10140 [Thiotrichaceae bacterium]